MVTAPKLEIETAPKESEVSNIEAVTPVLESLEPEIETQIESVIEQELEETEIESIEDVLEEASEDLVEEVQKISTLVPIKKLEVVETVEEVKTAVLKPVTMKVLTPVKRRGPPPSSAPAQKPGEEEGKEATASLNPVSKLTPVESPNTDLNIESGEDEA